MAAAVAWCSCRSATQVTLDLRTDTCASRPTLGIAAGTRSDTEGAAFGTTTTTRNGDEIGSLVLVPSGGKGDAFGVKVVLATKGEPADCGQPGAKGCIVARRALRYLPHEPLRQRIDHRGACVDVACDPLETCVNGACVDADIRDPSACAGDPGCDESALGQGDGGAAPAPTDYKDFADATNWSVFDTATVNVDARDFLGGTFDGRYVYFAPAAHGLAMRYDTRAAFENASSWAHFSTLAFGATASNFAGAAFDGRSGVVLLPSGAGVQGPLAVRHQTTGPLESASSWSAFDTSQLTTRLFVGSGFDGRYLYFVPNEGGPVLRYDTLAAFADRASWSAFDTRESGYLGAVFDGRYLFFASAYGPGVTRYDTSASFASASSWSKYDTSLVGANAHDFAGAAFDGRYVYAVPGFRSGSAVVTRYDTLGTFLATTSWSTFSVSTLDGAVTSFGSAAFDGRFVYFLPLTGPLLAARYDTTRPFDAAGAWSVLDLARVVPGAASIWGAVFDGRYLYLVPHQGGVVARFDARSPPAMPKLPAFFGSFL
jgi:hypothetical protein